MDTQVAAPTWVAELEKEAQQVHPSYEGRRSIWSSRCAAGECDRYSNDLFTFPDISEARGERVEVCGQHKNALDAYFLNQEVLAWFDYDTGENLSRYNRTNELVREFLGQ